MQIRLRKTIHTEDGVSLLLVTAALLVLFGFAALVVDIGAGFNERRQDQSAADVGALAAVQFAQPNPGCTSLTDCQSQAMANGATAAIAIADATLDTAAGADWNDAGLCGTPPSGFTATATSPCVAFENTSTAKLSRAWVRIPTRETATTFGRVLGVDSLSTSAEAIADTSYVNPGSVLPFLLPATTANYGCLKTGGNPNWGTCEDLPSTGNFGAMDFFLYGSADTPQTCSGQTNGRFRSNIARGVDHPLGIHPTGIGAGKEEPSSCYVYGAEPDMAYAQTGVLTFQNLEGGFIYGDSVLSLTGPYDGLLQESGGADVKTGVGGEINETPLWNYLSVTTGQCNGVDTPAEMDVCLAWAKTSGQVIFSADIVNSPRFGFTPEVWETTFLGPSQPYHIKGYKPVYVDSLYFGCSSSDCDGVHTPTSEPPVSPCPTEPDRITCGLPTSGNLVAVSAYILPADILPDVAKTPSPGSDEQRRYNLSK